jgi:hypothetical protein
MGHQMLNCFHLHDLNGDRNPFCSLAAVEAVGGELATVWRFERLLATMWAAYGGASSLGMAPMVAMVARGPSPRSGSVRKTLEYQGDGMALGAAVGKNGREITRKGFL